ncbi:MAG: right-handed parallel beta-helix repeat-containing protein, partial [Desulfobulbaceae bacterium]|nr:right-handed parallel beta-helix repeat-containing protein [Desulfobulbaceae bacterium]
SASVNGNTSTAPGGGLYVSSASTVTVDGGTINANSGQNGGGIGVNASTLTVADATINANTDSGSNGGGLNITGASTVSLTRCEVKGNKTVQRGGGIYVGAGTTTLTNCTVSGNTVGTLTWEEGGGIRNYGTLNLMNTTVAGNYAPQGGGLFNSGTATVINAIFWDNVASTSAPEIAGTVTVTYSDVEGGYAGTGNINVNPAFAATAQAASNSPTTGGDFHLTAASTSTAVFNGGTAAGAPSDDIDGEARVANPDMGADEYITAFVNTTTTGTATAAAASVTTIYVTMPYSDDDNSNNTYTVEYKLSAAETWTDHATAAAHVVSPYTTTITGLTTGLSYDVRLTYNDADGVTGDNPQIITGIVPAGLSRTVCASGADFTTIQAAIDATNDGDTVLVCDGTYSENINFNNHLITVSSQNGASVTTIQGSGANAAVATFSSGETANAVLDGFTLDNQATNQEFTRGVSITNSSTPTIKNCAIQGNTPLSWVTGPGLYVTGGTSGVTVQDSTFGASGASNTGGDGPGLYASSTSGSITVSGSTFSYNVASNNGGALRLVNAIGPVSFTTCTFSSNNANKGSVLYSEGSSAVSFTDCELSGNSSTYEGGALYLSGSSITLTGSSVNNNTGTVGGAAYLKLNASLTATSTTFNGNAAQHDGGGIYLFDAGLQLTLTKCSVKGNKAGQNGGGIYMAAGTTATLTNCTVSGNTTGDETWEDGGGIISSGTLNIYNSTISGNYAVDLGGGLRVAAGTTTITNSIFWGNVSNSAAQISGTATVTYSDVQGGFAGTGNIDADPLFTSAATAGLGTPTTGGDFTLTCTSPPGSCSPAVDSASATNAPADDIEGDARPVDIADMGDGVDDFDMGSDEFTTGGGSQVPDHYAISHSGNGVTCEAEQVTITAHNAAHAAITVTANTNITFSTSSNKGDWYKVSGSGTLNNGTADDGAASYTIPVGESNVVLALAHTETGAIDIDVSDGTATDPDDHGSEDPTLTFSAAGFRFYAGGVNNAITTQIGGKSSNLAPDNQTLTLRAVETDTDTGACIAHIGDTTTSINLAYECVNPATCSDGKLVGITNGTSSMTCPAGVPSGGTAISGNPADNVASYDGVTLDFDGTGTATFTMIACDVGQLRLHATKTLDASGNDPAVTLTGATNSFVSRPFGFDLVAADNPGATTPGGAAFQKAGVGFTTTAGAVLWEAGDDTNNDGIPDGHDDTDPSNNADLSGNPAAVNFGKESPAEGVQLSAVLNQPATGTDPGLAGTTAITSFTGGSGSSNAVQYDEVGIIEMAAAVSDNDYLGSGVAATSKSGYVGRFTPDHFRITSNSPSFAAGCTAGNFTYLGQSFGFGTAPTCTATAVNAAGTTTSNYGGDGTGSDFWKLFAPAITAAYYDDQIDGDAAFSATTPGSAALSDAADYNGSGTLTVSGATLLYARSAAPIAPFAAAVNLTLTAAQLTDNDSVCYDIEPTDGSCDPFTIANVGGTELRWGRVWLGNSFGSELEDLAMPLLAQYYNGSAFVTNSDDTCSTVTLDFVAGSYTGNLGTGETSVQFTSPPPVANGGSFNLSLTAPGNTNDGSVSLAATADPWLTFDWDNNPGTAETGPTATATFGVRRGQDRIINWREIYR